MPVEVRLPTILRPHVGGVPTVTAEGSTVGELFDGLVARYIRYTGRLDTPVGENDVVSIIPAVAGG